MRRRAGAQVPISFFSFQDVLLSLIGITIVITMIMFVNRITSLPRTSSPR